MDATAETKFLACQTLSWKLQQLVQKLSNCCTYKLKGIFISITMIGTLRGDLVPIGLEFLLECGRCRYRENVFTRLPVELRPRNVATRRIKP